MFTLQDGRECLYQWDLDRKVIVNDETIAEVHFCNKTDECSLVVETYSSDGVLVANIPNILLQTDFPIRVYAYCADGYTKVENIFKVKSRTRPNDYVYTETQTKTWTELAQAAEDTLQTAEDTLQTAQEAVNIMGDYKEGIEDELAEYKERIRILELANEGHTYAFTSVEGVAVKHDVPASALPYARLDSIGGNTKKCTNLLPMIPNTDWGIGTTGWDTSNDYHVWIDEDGYLTIDSEGRDTGISSVLELPESLFKNIPNKTKVSTYVRYVSGSANGGYAEGDEPCIVFPTFNMNIAMTEGATYTETQTFYTTPEWLYMQAVGVFDNLKLAITVVEGSTPVDEPACYDGLKSAKVTAVKSYTADGTLLDTYEMPAALQALSEYGEGVRGVAANTVDFVGKTYTKSVVKGVLLTATSSYNAGYGNVYRARARDWPSLAGFGTSICSHADNLPTFAYKADYKGMTSVYSDQTGTYPDKLFRPFSTETDSVDGMTTYFQEQYAKGTPVTLAYAVATPEITDLAAYITDTIYIRVEAGGYIVCENEDGIETPLTMTYQIKL